MSSFRLALRPSESDILTHVDGLTFDEAWAGRVATTFADLPVAVLSREHLIANTRAVGRLQDLADVARLLGDVDP